MTGTPIPERYEPDPLDDDPSRRLTVPFPGSARVYGRCVTFGLGESDEDDAGLDALAERVLDPAERKVWRAFTAPRRRRHWLLGRVVAKDAVRDLVRDGEGMALDRAGVAILTGPLGRPAVAVEATSIDTRWVTVSIAHIDRFAVAIACADPEVQGVGIDVERCRGGRAVERIGLNESERRGLDGLSEEARHDRSVRMWCAKEAVSKALGTGLSLLGGPRALTVERLDEHGARLRVVVAPPPGSDARWLDAATRRDGDLVLATAVAGRSRPGVARPERGRPEAGPVPSW